MDTQLIGELEQRVTGLLDDYASVKLENQKLREENRRLLEEREGFKQRVDAILRKLEGI
jgi:cell division protein ZapB